MKLGIVVVYVVSEENSALLELHLNQIERHTEVPYTIYAGVNRLLPRFRERLASIPRVKTCDCPTTMLRGKEEHSCYLEHLVQKAVDDGASHVVTLHVDSFPIVSGWARLLADRLVDSCVAAMPPKYHFTACLFFGSDFYTQYRPRFLLDPDELNSTEYERFEHEFEHWRDSGFGYAFKIFSEGLSFYPLVESVNKSWRKSFATIHDDMVYHLHSAVYMAEKYGQTSALFRHPASVWAFEAAVPTFKKIVPDRLRWKMRSCVLRRGPVLAALKAIQETEKAKLLADPDGYLAGLRSLKGRA